MIKKMPVERKKKDGKLVCKKEEIKKKCKKKKSRVK